jgi:NAD(P)H-dependent FMN reductase
MSVRLLAFAASYRPDSLNRKLLGLAIEVAKQRGAEVTVLDYAALEAPIYRGETLVDALPQPIADLSTALRAHHGLLIASPEYNWSMPGSLKNIIDWLSIDPQAPLNRKSALLMCATPSMRSGISGLLNLRTTLDVLGVWTYPQLVGVGKAEEQLQPTRLARESDQNHLDYCVTDFIRTTKALHA